MALFLNAQEVELLSAMSRNQARYIVVGGHAVQHHGHLRPAKDLDLWLEPMRDNAERMANALASIGTVLSQDQISRLAKPNLQMRIGGLHTELLTTMQGLEFNSAMARSVTTTQQGVPCQVLSRCDLIMNKRLLARKSDLEDVAVLEQLKKSSWRNSR
jgi:hypothetical protein